MARCDKYDLIRYTDVFDGRIRMTFYYGREMIRWTHQKGMIPPSTLLKTFPELSADDISKIFGSLSLGEPVEKSAPNEFESIQIPASRENVETFTESFVKWWRDGFEACENHVKERGLRDWLWEEALATSDTNWEFIKSPNNY